MTKPDMLTLGSTKARDLWLDVIEGRRHSLTHGYYCTRQPDDAERSAGVTSANARVTESTYFKETVPWSTSAHKHRFGTNNLIATLSALLVQVIKDTYVVSYPASDQKSITTFICSQASKSSRRNYEVSGGLQSGTGTITQAHRHRACDIHARSCDFLRERYRAFCSGWTCCWASHSRQS